MKRYTSMLNLIKLPFLSVELWLFSLSKQTVGTLFVTCAIFVNYRFILPVVLMRNEYGWGEVMRLSGVCKAWFVVGGGLL